MATRDAVEDNDARVKDGDDDNDHILTHWPREPRLFEAGCGIPFCFNGLSLRADIADYARLYEPSRLWFERYKKRAGAESVYKLCVQPNSGYLVRLSREVRDAVIAAARDVAHGGATLSAATGGCNEPKYVCGRVLRVQDKYERGRRCIVVEVVELDIGEAVRAVRLARRAV